jgi:lactoylglutathione lyase
MSTITHVSSAMVPVADQDAAIAFYTDVLGFTVSADVAFGEGERWVEVAPPAGGTTIALVPARGEYPAGQMTGIALAAPDGRAAREALQAQGVDADEPMGGDGTVPLLFFFRDLDGNTLLVVEGA